MTRCRSFVNTICVKFNKLFEPYHRVSTGTDIKTPLRDVDRPNGLNNQQSKIGWKAGPVFKKLGSANTRRMGLTSGIRVSARIISDTLANKANAINKVLC